jgi:hypothetical protein
MRPRVDLLSAGRYLQYNAAGCRTRRGRGSKHRDETESESVVDLSLNEADDMMRTLNITVHSPQPLTYYITCWWTDPDTIQIYAVVPDALEYWLIIAASCFRGP